MTDIFAAKTPLTAAEIARRAQIERIWQQVYGKTNAELAGSPEDWAFYEALLAAEPEA